VSSVSYPGNVSVGPNQHGSGGRHQAEYRKLPRTGGFNIYQLNPIGPRSDVADAGLAEVEEHGPGAVQQRERPLRPGRGVEVLIRHAAPSSGCP